MALTSTTRSVTYEGDGAETVFNIPFRFEANGDLVVKLINESTGAATLQSEVTHYTVVGAADVNGGTLTMLVAPTGTEKLFIERVVALTQASRFANVGVEPRALEARQDLVYMALQQINANLRDTTIYTDAGKPTADETLAGSCIMVKDAGQPMRIVCCGQEAGGDWVWEDIHVFSF